MMSHFFIGATSRMAWRGIVTALAIPLLSARVATLSAEPGDEPSVERTVPVSSGAILYAEESIDEAEAFAAAHPERVGEHRSLAPGRTADYEYYKAMAEGRTPEASAVNENNGNGNGHGNGHGHGGNGPLSSFPGPGVCGCEPPDPILTVGTSHVLMGINDQLRAANKSGVQAWSVSWETFFASVNPAGAGSFASDPKLFFDPSSQRYFATILMVNSARTKSWWMLAVSTTDNISDSTSTWRKWAFDPTIAHASSFADYPAFGFDGNAIYLTSNMFNTAGTIYLGTDLAVFPKAQLLVSTPTPTFTQLVNVTTSGGAKAFTLQPCHMLGASPPNEFLVNAASGSGSSIFVYQVDNPLGSPTLTKTSVTVTSYSSPPNAAQSGTTTLVNTGDTRLYNAVWINNSVWTSHGTSSGGLASARWYQINTSAFPTATLTQSGTYNNGTAHYYYPTVAVDASGNMAMGFSRSKSTEFASAWHTSRFSTDASGTLAAPTQDKAGNHAYTGTRWGDFSGTVIDAADGSTFWTLQEYAGSGAGTSSGWGTWCTSFQLAVCVPPTVNTISNAGATCGVSFTSITPSTSAGTTPITWSLGAGAPAGMTINAGTGAVSWPTPVTTGSPYTITTIATNGCGNNSKSWTLTVAANPPAIAPISNDATLCGIAYTSAAPSAGGGAAPLTWSLLSAPAGMTIDASTGAVSWPSPDQSGSPYTITVEAASANGCGTDSKSWALTVNDNPPAFNPISNAFAVCGAPYTSPAPITIGGAPPLTWTLLSGPAGMTIDASTGAVTWPSPTATGSPFAISVQAASANNCGTSAPQNWQLGIVIGDYDSDGLVTESDVSGFVNDLLLDPPFQTCAGDLNGDGFVDGLDIPPFDAALGL